MTIQVRRIEAVSPARAQAFGGKAKNLAAMARAGLPVPAAHAVSADLAAELFRAVLAPADLPEALVRAPAVEVSAERLTELRGRIARAPLGAEVEQLLARALADLRARGAKAIAVRSSSVIEDDEQRAAAGIHDTVLGVTGEAELFAAVRTVAGSVLTPRAIAYLRALGERGDAPAAASHVGIVLQALVAAETSGVLFTANPVSGDPGEMVVNAAWGLGTAVVDGSVSPDTWRIDKASGWIRDRVVGDKAQAARLGDVVTLCEVEPALRSRPSLTDPQLERLVALGRRIEAQLGGPRDIEWALAKDTFFVLQARPITALERAALTRAQPRTKESRARTVWSNVNVGEALPGVATPLTWSILSKFSDAGFRRAFGSLGCTVPDDAELVGNFRGRIYLNLTEFTAIAAQVPGLSPRTLLSLGGGGEVDTLETSTVRSGRTAFTLRLPVTAARFVRENFRLTERVRRWEESFSAERDRALAVDLRVLSAGALRQVLVDVERLLDSAGLMMLNVYGNLLGTVVALRTLLGTLGRGEARERPDRRLRELLTGLSDVDSAAPGLELMRIAELARREDGVRALFERGAPGRVEELPAGPTRTRLEAFLVRWGDRGTREAEIAEPRWREDPSLLLGTLRLHVRAAALEPADAIEARQRRIRDGATATALADVPLVARPAARSLIELTQHFLRLRERLRAHVVTVLGLYRRVALDASRRIEAMELGAGEGELGAAFFLTIDELLAVLAGDARKVAPLVQTRRVQFRRDAALPSPPDTFVGQPPPPELRKDVVLLRGLAASSGSVEGRARVLLQPTDAARMEPGEILVAAQADVGLSPLFLACRAVLADLGGPLSHASIVAREMGIPAVVNLKHATTAIRDGDLLAVDGDEGTVRIVARA